MSLATTARNIASRMITKYGKAVTLTRVTAGDYDVATSSIANTSEDETPKAIVEEYRGNEIDGNNIRRGDKKLTFAALDIDEPSIGDTVTINAVVYVILQVSTTYAQSDDVVYEVQARKA